MQLRAQDGYIDAITQAVPHLFSSRGFCKPTDEYPLLHLGGHRGARISGAVASRTIGLSVS